MFLKNLNMPYLWSVLITSESSMLLIMQYISNHLKTPCKFHLTHPNKCTYPDSRLNILSRDRNYVYCYINLIYKKIKIPYKNFHSKNFFIQTFFPTKFFIQMFFQQKYYIQIPCFYLPAREPSSTNHHFFGTNSRSTSH